MANYKLGKHLSLLISIFDTETLLNIFIKLINQKPPFKQLLIIIIIKSE